MTRTIPLTRGRVALVDDADYPAVAAFKWHCLRVGYAARSERKGGRKHTVYLHRQIMGAEPGVEVDHKNCDKLDCRRANLRYATSTQNKANRARPVGSSAYRGVAWDRARRKWLAGLSVNNRRVHIGRFDSEEDAARAYDSAAIKHYGEFARLNFNSAAEGE